MDAREYTLFPNIFYSYKTWYFFFILIQINENKYNESQKPIFIKIFIYINFL